MFVRADPVNALRETRHPSTRRAPINPRDMFFARHASRAARRAASASNLAVSSPHWPRTPANILSRRGSTVEDSRRDDGHLPFAVEAGSAAAGYTGGLLNPADLKRIAHDLSAMPRKRIEGPTCPRRGRCWCPLPRLPHKVPHALFAVKPDDFGAPHAGFPGVPGTTTTRTTSAPRCARLSGSSASGTARVCASWASPHAVDVPKQCAVTPVVGPLGELDVEEMTSMSALEKSERTLIAVRLDDLLGKESVDVALVPGSRPDAGVQRGRRGGKRRREEGRAQDLGFVAQILHQVMRVVVGPRKGVHGGAVRAIRQQEVRRGKLQPVT